MSDYFFGDKEEQYTMYTPEEVATMRSASFWGGFILGAICGVAGWFIVGLYLIS